MAVRVLPRSSERSTPRTASLPALVLGVVLIPSALDLLGVVQLGVDQITVAVDAAHALNDPLGVLGLKTADCVLIRS